MAYEPTKYEKYSPKIHDVRIPNTDPNPSHMPYTVLFCPFGSVKLRVTFEIGLF